ncbi:MAG: sugar transferase [Candidatus Paceibacterota bacterium]
MKQSNIKSKNRNVSNGVKRTFDVVGSFLILLITLPFLILIALAIIFENGFPMLVKLDRVSEGEIVRVYKFRSMIKGAHAMKKDLKHLNERSDGPFFKIKNDPRLTSVGKFLRKIRVDELPQFINVLKGELSIIGPRPHELSEIEKYPDKYRKIPFAKAGVTGLSQISGASALNYLEELELDLFYIENQSLWLDIKILFKTFWIFISDPTGV